MIHCDIATQRETPHSNEKRFDNFVAKIPSSKVRLTRHLFFLHFHPFLSHQYGTFVLTFTTFSSRGFSDCNRPQRKEGKSMKCIGGKARSKPCLRFQYLFGFAFIFSFFSAEVIGRASKLRLMEEFGATIFCFTNP